MPRENQPDTEVWNPYYDCYCFLPPVGDFAPVADFTIDIEPTFEQAIDAALDAGRMDVVKQLGAHL